KLLEYINLEINGNQAIFKPSSMHKQARANWGTMTSLFKNALQGATEGFFKILEIEGVGYRASMEGNTLILSVGFTRPVKYTAPENIKIIVDKNGIKISGIDRQLVGQVAAQIRKIKKPEPYKGKGIHYQGEVIRRKAGKKVAGATATA
ncbi:MAG: 50S ribosomal protein L6, partial [Candidatus Harrisonbacteria bacterium RIFCSPHIGHO2_02_FULL_40_20]